jgi:hypothetical protein
MYTHMSATTRRVHPRRDVDPTHQEFIMRIRTVVSAALIALASAGFVSAASAQGLTRAEVQQQLIDAEAHGSQFVTEASYPDVSRVYTQQVAHSEQQSNGYGATMAGTSAAGAPATMPGHHQAPNSCVGPVSFCDLYFGS